MTAHLMDSDRQLIQQLRKAGVLTKVEQEKLDQKNGILAVPCADGDQMSDLFAFQQKMQKGHRHDPRLHMPSLNGGALLIPENSPLNKPDREDLIMLKHIRQGVELKGMDVVALYAHAPCGMAGLYSLNAEQVIDLLLQAKTRVKQTLPGKTIACFFHVDYNDGRKRTYFVDRDKWEAYQEKRAV